MSLTGDHASCGSCRQIGERGVSLTLSVRDWG